MNLIPKLAFMLLFLSLASGDYCNQGRLTDRETDSCGDAMGRAKVYFKSIQHTDRSYKWGIPSWAKVTCSGSDYQNCYNCMDDLMNVYLPDNIWKRCNYAKSGMISNDLCSLEYGLGAPPS